MNPFISPSEIYLAACPIDMRCGIEKLSAIVESEFGSDPADGALYGFVSRDCAKMKLLRFKDGAWCLYYLKLQRGTIKWYRAQDGHVLVKLDGPSLIMLAGGLDL